jgi:hypothetical protein
LSASDVTHVVSLDTNNQAEVYEESRELLRDMLSSLLLLLIDFVNQTVCFAVLTRYFRFNLQTVLLSG